MLDHRGDVDAVDLGPELEELCAARDRGQRGLLGDLPPPLHHRGFLDCARIAHEQLEQEAVRLGLGQGWFWFSFSWEGFCVLMPELSVVPQGRPTGGWAPSHADVPGTIRVNMRRAA